MYAIRSYYAASYDSLAAGKPRDVEVSYTVTDASGATSTSTLTITVTGTNDAPVANVATAAATEGGAVITGAVTATDVDTGDHLTYALDGAAPRITSYNVCYTKLLRYRKGLQWSGYSVLRLPQPISDRH